jgi:hypothetical protein
MHMAVYFVATMLVRFTVALVRPPKAAPFILGTSDYSSILFGKIQRAASLFGTNLCQPRTILSEGDYRQDLENCLWHKFGMATSGSIGTLKEKDILSSTSPCISLGDLTDSLIFIDAASSANDKNLKPNLLEQAVASLQNDMKQEVHSIPTQSRRRAINQELLSFFVDRKCAHVYVLSDHASLSTTISILNQHCVSNNVACTILTLGSNVALKSTSGWVCSRPQGLKGELTGPVELVSWKKHIRPSTYFGSAAFPVEDAAEVMLQVALRVDRSPKTLLRVVCLFAPRTHDAFHEGRHRQGKTQSSWTSLLSPSFGPVIRSLGKRPDS